MKLSVYNSIVGRFRSLKNSFSCVQEVATFYPEIGVKTLGSICSQECQRKMKKTHRRHLEKMDEYYFRYCEESQQQPTTRVILHMATRADVSPALLARIILERHLAYSQCNGQQPPKSLTSKMMKDTSEIDDTRLAMEIDACLAADDVYGPVVDVVKHSIGHEYEFHLQRSLDEAGLAYLDETRLRAKGYDKTPDFILQVPISVDGRVVNWIESKASFGDPDSHDGYLKDQFWSYWNRFGAGLVIYWFGFVDELDKHRDRGIMLMDRFPENIVTMPSLSSSAVQSTLP